MGVVLISFRKIVLRAPALPEFLVRRIRPSWPRSAGAARLRAVGWLEPRLHGFGRRSCSRPGPRSL